jgi:hypothetical protein
MGLVGLGVLAVVAAALIIFFTSSRGETLLYFNANSDLPDPLIYLKTPNATGPPTHVLDIGRTYDIIFSAASLESKPADYTLTVKSDLVNKIESFSLEPEDVKTFSLTVSPKEDRKWILNSTEKTERENYIDITKNSWLAERRDFTVIVREGGLPAIVEEKYNLPISSDLESFGRVYHMNVTLDEIKAKPFERDYTETEAKEFNKKVQNTSIVLSVEGGQLHVKSTLESKQYISEPERFVVRLSKKDGLEEKMVDDTTGLENVQEISFIYQIR